MGRLKFPPPRPAFSSGLRDSEDTNSIFTRELAINEFQLEYLAKIG